MQQADEAVPKSTQGLVVLGAIGTTRVVVWSCPATLRAGPPFVPAEPDSLQRRPELLRWTLWGFKMTAERSGARWGKEIHPISMRGTPSGIMPPRQPPSGRGGKGR